MQDDTSERIIKLPRSWVKPLIGLLSVLLAGGGGGSLFSSNKMSDLEVRSAAMEVELRALKENQARMQSESDSRREWLVKLTDRVRELERGR